MNKTIARIVREVAFNSYDDMECRITLINSKELVIIRMKDDDVSVQVMSGCNGDHLYKGHRNEAKEVEWQE